MSSIFCTPLLFISRLLIKYINLHVNEIQSQASLCLIQFVYNLDMLKPFDFFRKIQTDQELTSATGGIFTLVAIIVAGLLIFMSLQDFYQQKYFTFLAVKNDDSQYLPMRIEIQFNHMPCEAITIQFKDQLEYVENHLEEKLTMRHVPKDGGEGEEYKRSGDRQLEKETLIRHLIEDYRCRVMGIIALPKTPGTLTFSGNGQDNLIWEIEGRLMGKSKMSYRIDALTFGLGDNKFDFPIAHKSKNIQKYIKELQGDFGNRQFVQNFHNQQAKVNFFNHLKIIPVVIQNSDKTTQNTQNYRYSLRAGWTQSNQPTQRVMFMTQIQPINIVYRKHEVAVYDLLRQLLAIVGGTVATIGIFNSVSHFILNIK